MLPEISSKTGTIIEVGLPGQFSWQTILLQCRTLRFDSWIRKFPWRRDRIPTPLFLGFPGGSDGKQSICHVGDLGLSPELERSPGGGHCNPLQYSRLENPHGQRTVAVQEVKKNQKDRTTKPTIIEVKNYHFFPQFLVIPNPDNRLQQLEAPAKRAHILHNK